MGRQGFRDRSVFVACAAAVARSLVVPAAAYAAGLVARRLRVVAAGGEPAPGRDATPAPAAPAPAPAQRPRVLRVLPAPAPLVEAPLGEASSGEVGRLHARRG